MIDDPYETREEFNSEVAAIAFMDDTATYPMPAQYIPRPMLYLVVHGTEESVTAFYADNDVLAEATARTVIPAESPVRYVARVIAN